MREKASSDQIDIVISDYSYCAVTRESALQTYTLPRLCVRSSYNGAIEELDLDFKHAAAAVFIPLVRYVGAKLKRLCLGSAHAVPLSKAHIESFLACCPKLDEISFGDADTGVLSVFSSAYRENVAVVVLVVLLAIPAVLFVVIFVITISEPPTPLLALLTRSEQIGD